MFKRRFSTLLFIMVTFSLTLIAQSFELPPGRIVNPDGNQLNMEATYNSERDEYLLSYYGGGVAYALRLRPDADVASDRGIITPPIVVAGGGVNNTGLAYNPDRDEYLFSYRIDSTTNIYGRYLAGDAQPLGDPFLLGAGLDPEVAYSTGSHRYVVVWKQSVSGNQYVRYATVDGDSTAANPKISGGTVASGGSHSPAIAYNSIHNLFLIAYVKELSIPTRANINGRVLSGNGISLGADFTVAGGYENQQKPEIAYSSKNNLFLVTFEDWVRVGTESANVAGHFVTLSASGSPSVSSRFIPFRTIGSNAWDVPGPLTFNSSTGKFIATAYYGVQCRYREIDIDPENPNAPVMGELDIIANLASFPTAATARPDPADAQALVLTRSGFGSDGVHAHIIHLPPPPPSFSSTEMPIGFFNAPYSEPVPVVGGTQPLEFQYVSGDLAPGLTGPDATGIVSGTPTSTGTFGPFTVRVVDAEGREVVGDLYHTITLAPPTLLSPPNGDVTADNTPEFVWSAVDGATSYRLIAAVNGSPELDTTTSATSLTPSSSLPDGIVSWQVEASNATHTSPPSATFTFELDTTPPAQVANLEGRIPPGLNQITGTVAISSSGELDGYEKENAVDGDLQTFWMTPLVKPMREEEITIDLGVAANVGQVRLHPRYDLPTAFPRDFEIQLSEDNVDFVTVQTVSDLVAENNTWYTYNGFAPMLARYVRIRVTESNPFGNLYTVQIAEIEVAAAEPALGAIELKWTSTGDDGNIGTASEYDVRYTAGISINWDSAIEANGEPTPATAGTEQTLLVSGLDPETFYTFALTAEDNAGNISPVSDPVTVATAGIPPGRVSDLAALEPGLTTVRLTWTAPFEDGNSGGTVSSYEVRWSESPITEDNFSDATLAAGVLEPNAPLAAPTQPQSMSVTGLQSNSHYYFALVSVDDALNVSLLSNVAEGETLDGIPPATIDTLQGSSGTSVGLLPVSPLAVADSSSELAPYLDDNVVDGDTSTFWMTPLVKPAQPEYVTLDLGSEVSIAQVRMRSRQDVATAFPKSFEIQVSTDGGATFQTMLSVSDFPSAEPGQWYPFDLPVVQTQYVKVLITEPNLYGNRYSVQIAEIEVMQVQVATDSVVLQWTAPGDDGTVGTATTYYVRYSPNDPDVTPNWWDQAQDVADPIPTPQPAGSLESLTVTNLGFEAVNWFAVKTEDDAGNLSDVSNIVKVATTGTAPDPITDLRVDPALTTSESLTLKWTATSDDGLGLNPAARYSVRYSASPINNLTDFVNAMVPADAPPTPGAPGTTETFEVTGLAGDTTYYFAVLVIDDADNFSDLSNPAMGTTADVVPPAQVNDLEATLLPGQNKVNLTVDSSSSEIPPYVDDLVVDGDPATFWVSEGSKPMRQEWITVDMGEEIRVDRLRLLSRADSAAAFPHSFDIQVSLDGNTFTTVHSDTVFPAALGTWYPFSFNPVTARYVRLLVTESNLYGNRYYVHLAEMEVYQASGQNIQASLSWTAPGDNADQGAATRYDVRYAEFAISEGNWDSAQPAPNPPTPQPVGETETFVVGNLPGEATVYFALKAFDEMDNPSPISNLDTVVTPGVPPAAVGDLAATPVNDTSIRLSWTAVGDDDNVEGSAADSYIIRWSPAPILTNDDFNAATPIDTSTLDPAPQGSDETFLVEGLDPDTTYHFAMKVADEIPNVSGLSNPANASTVDSVAPAAIGNLEAAAGGLSYELQPVANVTASSELSPYVKEKAVDGDPNTFWMTALVKPMQVEWISVDLGSVYDVGRVSLVARHDLATAFPHSFDIQVSTGGDFTTVHSATVFPATPGETYTFTFDPVPARYVRLSITEVNLYGNLYSVQLAEMEVYKTMPAGVALTWTAPGDNGTQGTADSYEVRYLEDATIAPGNFTSGVIVPGVPTPQPAGTGESFNVLGLDPGTYHFMIKTYDEAGNFSYSNEATAAINR